MCNLFVFTGKKIAAGLRKLAVFFLFSLLFINNSFSAENKNSLIPFVVGGKLYYFSAENQIKNLKIYDSINNGSTSFQQKAVSPSKKSGYILAWNQKKQELYHISKDKKIVSSIKVPDASVILNEQYLLSQSSFFDNHKGFAFTLYKISYSKISKKIGLKKIWNGNIDCFISDYFFTSEGICICGGDKEDKEHNVFLISEKGIHKCFSILKNGDFLRMINTDDGVISFLSGRDKSKKEEKVFKFYLDKTESEEISLQRMENFPTDFQCFFGYGFCYKGKAVIPSSINDKIVFLWLKEDEKMEITECNGGCFSSLKEFGDEYFFISKDPLNENSFYGISSFRNGTVYELMSF